MIWTKLKKLTEDLLADSLQGRMAYHLTRYGPGLSYLMTRGWITLDGREIVGCSTIRHVREVHRLTGEWYQRDPDVLRALHRESIFTRTEFIEALEACVSQPINLLLQSSQPLMRANALLDRGVGKRRLREMDFSLTEVPVIRDFYAIRCQAEGITQPGKLL